MRWEQWERRHMGSFTKLIYHVVFGTKYRRALITDKCQNRLYEYIGGIIRQKHGHMIEVGGITDHIHILAHLPPTIAVSDMIKEIKGSSSAWMNEERLLSTHFEWQKGYGAFSVSYSQVGVVQEYIRNQEDHHRKRTFEEEYIAILKRHDIEFEHRFLFEAEHHG